MLRSLFRAAYRARWSLVVGFLVGVYVGWRWNADALDIVKNKYSRCLFELEFLIGIREK